MNLPTRRRSSAVLQPGDIALLVVGGGLLLMMFAATVGVALACALFGGGWVWPHGVAGDARLLSGLLTGAPARGLPATARAAAPGAATIYVLVAATVLTALVVAVVAARWLVDLLGEGGGEATAGFATRGQTRRALSGRALPRRRVREIRPDLYEVPAADEPDTGDER